MYEASHECAEGDLRVEDYIYEPLNYYNTSLNVNDSIDLMMADSISLYTDRILNSVYSQYENVTYNEADFIMAYPHFGNNVNKNMEIWPTFSAEDCSSHCSRHFCYYAGDDFSGHSLCYANKFDTADWCEGLYYDSLVFSEKYQEFTSSIANPTPMGADTNFEILGSAWYDYLSIRTQDILFDTLTSGTHKGYKRFYVTLPHDVQWFYPSVMPPRPFYITATVHGGVPSYHYIWYDMDSRAVLQSDTTRSLKITWSPTYPHRIKVLAVDGNDSTAVDYINIYPICQQPPLETPVHHNKPKTVQPLAEGKVKVYPNPNKGTFNISMQNINENAYVEIYNALGQKVLTEVLVPSEINAVSLSNHPCGIYFYRIIKENGNLIKAGKIVVEQ